VRGTAEHGASTLLHSADWLTRHYPDFAARHRLVFTALRESPGESLLIRDVLLNQPALMAIEPPGSAAAAAACVCPAFTGHPVRALLDDAATGLPVVTTESPALREIFAPHEAAYVAAGNPLALAHTLVDLAANPAAAQRRAAAAQRRVLAHHEPQALLARWQSALESVVAAAR
jgi:glycosyltransferase involved in cell wall biosynthesis